MVDCPYTTRVQLQWESMPQDRQQSAQWVPYSLHAPTCVFHTLARPVTGLHSQEISGRSPRPHKPGKLIHGGLVGRPDPLDTLQNGILWGSAWTTGRIEHMCHMYIGHVMATRTPEKCSALPPFDTGTWSMVYTSVDSCGVPHRSEQAVSRYVPGIQDWECHSGRVLLSGWL